MSKKCELLFSLVCLFTSLFVGNSIFEHLTERAAKAAGQAETNWEYVSRGNSAHDNKLHQGNALAPMLNFTLQDEFGIEKSFQDVREGAPAFVYFFSGGCNLCFNNLEGIKPSFELARKYQFRIVGIEFLGTPEYAKKFRERYDLPSPVFSDPRGEVCGRFGVGEFTVILVGADNNVYYRNLMNGSNWPGRSDFINALAMEAEGVPPPTITETPAPPAGNYVKLTPNKTVNKIMSAQTPVQFLPLSNLFNLRVRYFEYVLILIILVATAATLPRRETSWLPLLAASELLLVGIFYGFWNSWPANIFLFITAILLISSHKKMFGPAVAFGMFTIIGLLHPVFNEYNGVKSLQLQQMAVIWRFFPQIALSLLMFRLAFTAQKQQYEKLSYAYGAVAAKEAHDGAITVRGVSKPERCDVCHQIDMFDAETGYCARCKANTL